MWRLKACLTLCLYWVQYFVFQFSIQVIEIMAKQGLTYGPSRATLNHVISKGLRLAYDLMTVNTLFRDPSA